MDPHFNSDYLCSCFRKYVPSLRINNMCTVNLEYSQLITTTHNLPSHCFVIRPYRNLIVNTT